MWQLPVMVICYVVSSAKQEVKYGGFNTDSKSHSPNFACHVAIVHF
jgi:hypothetical protein